MFGHRYFGARYFGPRYWGDGGTGAPVATARPFPHHFWIGIRIAM